MQAARQVEQKLWEQFRSACDAVFERSREQHMAAEAEQHANLKHKTALCAELEALLDNAAMDFGDMAQRFRSSRPDWAAIGSIPSKVERATQAHYEALQKRFAQRQQQEEKAAADRVLQGLRARTGLCENLEMKVQQTTPDTASCEALLEETRQAWQTLAVLDAGREKVLRARLDLASRALGGDGQARHTLLAALPKNLEQRLELCLQLEITAGIDSPVEFAAARMQYQVARLAEAMQRRHEEQDGGGERLRQLQITWYQAGPVPAAALDSLKARFERVIAAAQ